MVIPASMRRRFKINDGTIVVIEEGDQGVIIRPAVTLPIEIYSKRRQAEFLLSNAVGAGDYKQAQSEVIKLGINPETITHYKPKQLKRK